MGGRGEEGGQLWHVVGCVLLELLNHTTRFPSLTHRVIRKIKKCH